MAFSECPIGPPGDPTDIRLFNLKMAMSFGNQVGGFSMLHGLKVLTLGKLYRLIRLLYASVQRIWDILCTLPLWDRFLPNSDIRKCDRAEISNAIKAQMSYVIEAEIKEVMRISSGIVGVVMYGGCCFSLCGPFFWFLYFLGIVIAVLLPFLAPIAFLLKLRQVAFVSTVYWKGWSWTEWLKFFGVVNNVMGLTASEGKLINGYNKFVIEKSTEERYKFDDAAAYKALRYLIRKGVYERTESLVVTAMILNSWNVDPNRWMSLLRRYTPKEGTEEAEP